MLISAIKNLSKFISKNESLKKMGLIKHMAKEAMREIGNKSQEFYEFVLPPVDMHLEDNNLIVTIDIPGFKKEDIKLSICRNILSLNAQKKSEMNEVNGEIICKQRPNVIDKRIRLPTRIKEGEEKVNSAKYEDGVLTIKISVNSSGKKISID
jgi:HSP20 family molecular chaperone IbpA